jgi:hypothetical protein
VQVVSDGVGHEKFGMEIPFARLAGVLSASTSLKKRKFKRATSRRIAPNNRRLPESDGR